MNAAIYCRTATEGQGEPSALDRQEAACRAYAADHGNTIGPVVREVASGLARSRPGLAELRGAIEAGDIELVLVTTLDRVSRDARLARRTIAEWEAAGALVVAVRDTPLS